MGMGSGDRGNRRRHYCVPGHAHGLTFGCYHRYPFLKAERTCDWLAEAIDKARKAGDFALWAYVFMPDHVHLVVRPNRPEYDVAKILQSIKLPVARKAVAFLVENAPEWLPKITRDRGGRRERHFWQPGGGYDHNVDEPRTLRAMIDYIHLNPVRRGLVSLARDWTWSSASWFEELPGPRLVPDRIPSEWNDPGRGF